MFALSEYFPSSCCYFQISLRKQQTRGNQINSSSGSSVNYDGECVWPPHVSQLLLSAPSESYFCFTASRCLFLHSLPGSGVPKRMCWWEMHNRHRLTTAFGEKWNSYLKVMRDFWVGSNLIEKKFGEENSKVDGQGQAWGIHRVTSRTRKNKFQIVFLVMKPRKSIFPSNPLWLFGVCQSSRRRRRIEH